MISVRVKNLLSHSISLDTEHLLFFLRQYFALFWNCLSQRIFSQCIIFMPGVTRISSGLGYIVSQLKQNLSESLASDKVQPHGPAEAVDEAVWRHGRLAHIIPCPCRSSSYIPIKVKTVRLDTCAYVHFLLKNAAILHWLYVL